MGTIARHGHTEATTTASPEVVWRIITDVTRVREYSHECRGAHWKGSARTASPGVRFRGTNRSGPFIWSRSCVFTVVDEPRTLAWKTVGLWANVDSTEWRIDLEPTETGTRIVQSYNVVHVAPGAEQVYWLLVKGTPRPQRRTRGRHAAFGGAGGEGEAGGHCPDRVRRLIPPSEHLPVVTDFVDGLDSRTDVLETGIAMTDDGLRERVRGLMPRAKADLAEMVAFRSVHDPSQAPPEQCDAMVDWLLDAFTEVGLRDVAAHETSDGSKAVTGFAAGPDDAPTVLLYFHHDVQPPLDAAAWDSPVWQLTERDRRWYGRGAADCKGNIAAHLTALRALRPDLPLNVKIVGEGSEEQGTGGLEDFVPKNVELLRADAILVADSGNFAVGVPSLTTTCGASRTSSSPSKASARQCIPGCSVVRPRMRWRR